METLAHRFEILDGYRLIRFLGKGGFGEVWLCRSESMGDYRALKFVPTNHADRLEKEYEALLHYRNAASRLRSPHLVSIEHVGHNDAGLYYVMPLADGSGAADPSDAGWVPMSLATMVADRAGSAVWFSSREIIELMRPVLEALQTLSDAGLVHRDVKPDNVLFFNGHPCLGDISLLGADASVITRRGTPGYATPSWYVGGHPDMYGVAATLFTLLTSNSPDRMGRAAFLWPPQGEASLPVVERAEWKRLHGVIRRATDEKVSERFVDFRAMVGALAGTVPKTPRSLASSRKAAAIIVGCLLVTVWFIVSLPGGRNPSTNTPETPPTTHQSVSPVTKPEASTSQPVTQLTRRKPKMVQPGGRFQSTREKIIDHLGIIISQPSTGKAAPKRYDVDAYARSSAVIRSFKARDYSACLDALDAKHTADEVSTPEPEAVLFRCLLLIKLDREDEAEQELLKLKQRDTQPATPPGDFMQRLPARLVLWEALGGFEAGAKLVSETLATVLLDPDGWQVGTLERLYLLRARMLVQSGDYAAALADEKSAIALPLPRTTAGTMIKSLNYTEAQARQSHLNTMIMQWELLEHEFPEYGAYLESNGSPEPQPDRRDLRDID